MSIISNKEAQDLVSVLKFIVSTNTKITLPTFGNQLQLNLSNYDATKNFIVDINRKGSKITNRLTLQFRYTEVIIRIDFSGKHTNPDGTELTVPHIHIYKEGYQTSWAYPLYNNADYLYLTLN
jgi:hypothetical protein